MIACEQKWRYIAYKVKSSLRDYFALTEHFFDLLNRVYQETHRIEIAAGKRVDLNDSHRMADVSLS